MPTIATDRESRDGPTAIRRVPRAVRDLDELLFSPDGWFVIDAQNGQVPGVVIPSLDAGLALVGHGRVATVVGRLRPEVVVVDVDVEGPRGWAVAERLTAWAGGEGLWSLVRPSGGADGRCHVFLVPGARYDALHLLVNELRVIFRVAAKRIDLRHAVRPLSAPHRASGRAPLPHGSAADALRALQDQPWSGCRAAQSRPVPPRPSAGTSLRTAEASLRRRRREMPREWADFLETGARPPIGGSDHSRTTYEAIATLHLVRAGHSAESAWQRILTAHPEAMVRARSSCTRWVRWVWNPAVAADRSASAGAASPEVAAAVADGRERLGDLQWRVSQRRRPAFLLVGHLVLDRMLRTNSLRVPVPERDMYVDTGIDRKTVRAVLRDLDGGLGRLHREAWDPRNKEGSSFEFELTPGRRGVRQTPPPSSHTPLPTGLWGSLPRTCHSLWRTLLAAAVPTPTPALCQRSGMTEGPADEPGSSTVRTARAALLKLTQVGLVECTEGGQWIARAAVSDVHDEVVRGQRAAREEAVAAERLAFRAGCHSEWAAQRGAALRRNHDREQAWWRGLAPRERAERCREWSARFQELSVTNQESMKERLAQRRLAAGVDEPLRHDQWVDAMSMDAYVQRSIQRQTWFARLPSPLRQAYALAWQRHRNRFGISEGTALSHSRREFAAALPSGREARDEAFLATTAQLLLPIGEDLGATG